jgi:adenosylcobinamide-GDP ribazoletransferase
MASLILAVRFLTIAPVRGREPAGPDALGRAAWWFPAVGLALGAVLAGADRGLTLVCPAFLSAALVVTLWKAMTGGLHLDGLADCLDALAGADVGRRLEILRDPRIGVFGALGLIWCMLLDVGALTAIPPAPRSRILLLAPAIGRLAPLLVGPRFAPATPEHGIGARFLQALPRWAGPTHLVLLLALTVMLLGAGGALMAVGALCVAFAGATFFGRRLGGLTGDVLGAAVELGELAFLVAGAVLSHLGRV